MDTLKGGAGKVNRKVFKLKDMKDIEYRKEEKEEEKMGYLVNG